MRNGVLAAGVLLALAACADPTPSEAPVSPERTATAAPSSEPDAAELDPATIVWPRLTQREEGDVTVGVGMQLVRGDGTVVWSRDVAIDRSAPNPVGLASGPRGGVFVYGLAVDGGARVWTVDTATGDERELLTTEGTVVAGSVDPTGTWVYLAEQERNAEEVWLVRHPTAGGDRERVIELSQLFAQDASAGRDLMHWTPDGTRLLLQTCVGGLCSWDVVDVASGDVSGLDPPGTGPMVDVTNDLGLARSAACVTGPCPFVLVDLDTGDTQRFDPGAHNARLGTLPDGRSIAVYDTAGVGSGRSRIVAVEFGTGAERILLEPRVGDFEYALARDGQDEWVPDGWIVVAPSGTNIGEAVGPTLLRLRDGALVELPLPG